LLNTREGRNKIARKKVKAASKVIPMSLNGKDISQTNGHNTSASNAIGQQMTSSSSQHKNVSTLLS